MYILLFTHYLLFSANTLEGPRCPCRDRRAIGSPMASRPPWTRTHGGSERCRHCPPLTSEFMGMAGYAPTSFHDLMDDDVESDGSSIGDVVAPSHPLFWEWAMVDALGQPPVVAESL